MNFYLNAINDLVKHPDDNSAIGIILCKYDKEKVSEIEYALKNINQLIGVSDFNITGAIPKKLNLSPLRKLLNSKNAYFDRLNTSLLAIFSFISIN